MLECANTDGPRSNFTDMWLADKATDTGAVEHKPNLSSNGLLRTGVHSWKSEQTEHLH